MKSNKDHLKQKDSNSKAAANQSFADCKACYAPPPLQFKKKANKKKDADSKKPYSLTRTDEETISSSILKTFNEFKNLEITLPGGGEKVIVEPRYWMVPQKKKDGTERSRRSKKLEKQHDKAHRGNIKKKNGNIAHSAMASARVGKASPEQLEIFIQTVVNKAYEKYIKKGKKVPRSKNMPLLDMDRTMWKDRIQEWINKNEIGVDCTGFAYHALLNARIAAFGEDSEQVKKFKKRFKGEKKKIPWKSTDTYGGKESWSQKIDDPLELKPGDFLVRKASVDSKKRTHIIVVQNVKTWVVPTTGNILVDITTVESSGKAAKVEIGENKSDTRRIGPTKKLWRIGYKSKLSSIEGLKDFYFLRPNY